MLDYVKADILLKYKPGYWEKINPFIFIGPDLAVLVSAKKETVVHPVWPSSSLPDSQVVDISRSTERLNPGISMGMGVDLKVGYQFVTVEIGYRFALLPVNATPIKSLNNNRFDLTSNTITIQLGLNFSRD
jgi:hypothetical protein